LDADGARIVEVKPCGLDAYAVLAAVAQILCLQGNDRDGGKGVGYNVDVSAQ
jgi:hypothetical protein